MPRPVLPLPVPFFMIVMDDRRPVPNSVAFATGAPVTLKIERGARAKLSPAPKLPPDPRQDRVPRPVFSLRRR